MNYAIEMGSGAMIYVPSFRKTGQGFRKLRGRGELQTQTGWRALLSLFQNKESGIKYLYSAHSVFCFSYDCQNNSIK
jgi:hypothetical protein